MLSGVVVVVAAAAAFWRALVVTPAPALWHHASSYDINATSNATVRLFFVLRADSSPSFDSLSLSLATLSPLLEAAHKLRLKPKIPLQARLSLVSRPPFAGSLSQSFSTVVRHLRPRPVVETTKELLEGQAVVSCRCTVQLRGTGTGSNGLRVCLELTLQYLIHHVGERDIPPSRPFGRHPGHVRRRPGIGPRANTVDEKMAVKK